MEDGFHGLKEDFVKTVIIGLITMRWWERNSKGGCDQLDEGKWRSSSKLKSRHNQGTRCND